MSPSQSTESRPTRRRWAQHIGLVAIPFIYGASVLAGALRFLSPLPSKPRQQRLEVGSTDAIVPGAAPVAVEFNERKVWVIHDGSRIRAFDAECTHLGCNVDIARGGIAKGFACNCHGARFSRTGDAVEGPTKVPLDEYAIEETGGKVVLLDRLQTREV